MITHATIMGIVEVYTTSGKRMQSWVYLTLPEVKPTQRQWRSYQEISGFLHHWTEKKCVLSFLVTSLFLPSKSSKEADGSQTLYCLRRKQGSSPFTNWAGKHQEVIQWQVICVELHITQWGLERKQLLNRCPWSITPSLNYTHQKQREGLER